MIIMARHDACGQVPDSTLLPQLLVTAVTNSTPVVPTDSQSQPGCDDLNLSGTLRFNMTGCRRRRGCGM